MYRLFNMFLVLFITSLISCSASQAFSVRTAGTWRSYDPDMIAHILGNSIRIDWVEDDGKLALYWKGTFPRKLKNGSPITSIGDVHTMDQAILASMSHVKTFTYKEGQLQFWLSALGVSQTVRLTR